jgi:predicted glycoside hydrolase/deacetylase ChbG (UPF0249 family)
MPALIVTADDLGFSEERDRGILEAWSDRWARLPSVFRKLT